MTLWERQLFGILNAHELSHIIFCLLGVFWENAHFRTIVVAVELCTWTIGAAEAYRLELPFEFMATMAVIAAVGLAVHSREPGIFTNDKKEKLSKSK